MDSLTQLFSAGETANLLMFLSAFAGGIVASVSPCSLSMLPLIIGYVGGCSKENTPKTFIQLCFFILGTAIVFSIIGVVCAVTGTVFATTMGAYFTLIMASLIMVMGLKITGIIDFEVPVIIKSMPENPTGSLVVYPLFLGIAFALAGTPCSTPILAGIMAFAAIGKNLPSAVLMLFLFAIGQGVIIVMAGLFTSSIKNMKKLASYTNIIMKISGVLLIIAAVYLYYKVFSPLI